MLEKEKTKYSFNKIIVIFQAIIFPFILYGLIFGVGCIDVHYKIFNIAIINNTVQYDDVWKLGFDINISFGIIIVYFLIYMFLDFLISVIFLIEGGCLWYLSNIMRFYKNSNNLWIFLTSLSALFLILYIITYFIPKYENKNVRFFPGILILAPFFTIYNTLNCICNYSGIKIKNEYRGYIGQFGILLDC